MPLDIVTVGLEAGNPPRIANMRYSATADGQLAHYIDDTLRAIVPPEGWEAYCQSWPDAQALIDNLRSPQ